MLSSVLNRIRNNSLANHSFWAIFGNGLGNALFLFVGIIIARLLGKDLYGEYGIVKSTMFYIAMFASFGLGTTATKFIGTVVSNNQKGVHKLIKDITIIVFAFSTILALILLIGAKWLSEFVSAPQLCTPFRYLAIIVVFRALSTAQNGILAGFKAFKKIAINSLLSGFFIMALSIPLCYIDGLNGALMALTASQIFNYIINSRTLYKYYNKYPKDEFNKSNIKDLIIFSLPIALQECCVSFTNWVGVLMITKMSSVGELGVYTASIQWNAIVSFIPTLLMNVILSHIVSSTNSKQHHDRVFKQMIFINLLSTIIPVSIFYVFADFIATFYGQNFGTIGDVMKILILVPILESCGSIFKAEYVACNKNWLYFSFRLMRDGFMLVISYILLYRNHGINGAFYFAISTVMAATLFLFLLIVGYRKMKSLS